MKNGTIALSFGYMVTRDRKRKDGVRELLGIDLFEVSLTPAPANPETRILAMKSAADSAVEERPAALLMTNVMAEMERVGKRVQGEMEEEKLAAKAAKAAKKARPVKVKTFDC